MMLATISLDLQTGGVLYEFSCLALTTVGHGAGCLFHSAAKHHKT